jgi:hypothetical protein
MVHLDKQLSQEVKQYQVEIRQMKYIITQLVKQKKELEAELKNKNTKPTAPSTTTKSSIPSKPSTTKSLTLFFPTLKKPSPSNPKSNVKYIDNTTTKEALTLKTPVFIKFNQIQIENVENENFNMPTQNKVIFKKEK